MAQGAARGERPLRAPRLDRPALAVALLSAVTIGLLFVFASGPLRSFFGDVVIVVFLVSALAAVRVGTTRSRLVGVGLFSVGIELVQGLDLVGPDAHWLLHLTVGATFDPLDLCAYALGLLVAWGLERWLGRRSLTRT